MTPKRRKRPADDPLEAYRKLRKAVPKPGRVIPDKRKKLAERDERRQQGKDA